MLVRRELRMLRMLPATAASWRALPQLVSCPTAISRIRTA
jgi:hypothetical protein